MIKIQSDYYFFDEEPKKEEQVEDNQANSKPDQ